MKPITGQLIFREAGEKDGKRLMMVVGILAVPESEVIKGETQYNVSGALCEDRLISLSIDVATRVDVREHTLGGSLGHLVCAPIWRI